MTAWLPHIEPPRLALGAVRVAGNEALVAVNGLAQARLQREQAVLVAEAGEIIFNPEMIR